MKYLTLTWGEQQDLLEEGINEGLSEGVDLYDSCIDLVGAGLSDEEIAVELGYDLPRVQHFINKVRVRYASLCSHANAKRPADGQADQTPSDTKPAAEQSSPPT